MLSRAMGVRLPPDASIARFKNVLGTIANLPQIGTGSSRSSLPETRAPALGSEAKKGVERLGTAVSPKDAERNVESFNQSLAGLTAMVEKSAGGGDRAVRARVG